MAVDRDAMARNVFGSRGLVAKAPIPRVHGAADTTVAIAPFDTVAAAALLDSAGWRRGPDGMRRRGNQPLRFTTLVFAGSALRSRYAVMLQEQFRRMGIQMETDPQTTAFVSRQSAGDWDAVTASFALDPSVGGIRQAWATSGIGQFNNIGYSNPTVDALLDSAASTGDASAARRQAKRALEIVAADAPAIWLFDVLTLAAVHRRIETKPFRGDGWWVHLDKWSIPADKRIDRDRIGLTPARP
jgi:peptide/nickel transport system substrate-binding protein